MPGSIRSSPRSATIRCRRRRWPEGGGYNDRLLFDSPDRRREAATEKREGHPEVAYGLASVLLEAKQWNADFTERFSEERSYRDASHQVKYYLERTPDDLG